ncbi:MAG: alpha/beta hydrolase, partial [Sphingobacteriaceae bacterium]
MKRFTATLILFLTVSVLYAQNITGDWYGTLHIQANSLHLVFHISKSGDAYSSTMDSPDQNAFGLATDATTFSNNQLTVLATKFGIKYIGTFKADSNKIAGTFTQGADIPLTLSHQKPTAALAPAARPQDP